MKKILCLLLCLFGFFAFTGCGNETKPSAAPQKVTLGMLRLTSSAPLFIAMDRGYFAEENLDVVPQWFDAAQPIAVACASSKIDVGATGITAGLYNMAAKGQKLYLVADKGREQKDYPSSALMAGRAAYNAGLVSIETLKGHRIGVTQRGSTYEYMIGRLLESVGLSIKDVTLVPLGKMSAVMAALESGQIDACVLNEPNVTKTQNAGYGVLLAQVGDIIPYQTSAIFYSPEFAQKSDAAARFLRAYKKALADYHAAVIEKSDETKLAAIVSVIAKYTNTPEEDIRAALPYIDKEGALDAADIDTQITWYRKEGLLEGNLCAADMIATY